MKMKRRRACTAMQTRAFSVDFCNESGRGDPFCRARCFSDARLRKGVDEDARRVRQTAMFA